MLFKKDGFLLACIYITIGNENSSRCEKNQTTFPLKKCGLIEIGLIILPFIFSVYAGVYVLWH
jgi:hypothetical protein